MHGHNNPFKDLLIPFQKIEKTGGKNYLDFIIRIDRELALKDGQIEWYFLTNGIERFTVECK